MHKDADYIYKIVKNLNMFKKAWSNKFWLLLTILKYNAAINNDGFQLLRRMSQQVRQVGYRVACVAGKIEYMNACVYVKGLVSLCLYEDVHQNVNSDCLSQICGDFFQVFKNVLVVFSFNCELFYKNQ